MRRVPLIEQHYQQILEEKVRDLAAINPDLEVKTIGFQDLDGQILGVVITPWFMDLFLLTDELEGWRADQTGEHHFQPFPAGDFHFAHAWDAKIGAYGISSLFSPMDDFPDQATAERTALRALEQLFVAVEKPQPETDSFEESDMTSDATSEPRSPESKASITAENSAATKAASDSELQTETERPQPPKAASAPTVKADPDEKIDNNR
ncbi:MAG: [NiFe]-hydrogenase assembly chaperone HybE, partial [Motiliproteus sp.]